MQACYCLGLGMHVPIELNTLESERFGVVAARACDPAASPEALNSAAVAQGVQLLTIRIDCRDHSRIHALEADGFRLMDTIVYYERSLSEMPLVLGLTTMVVVLLAPSGLVGSLLRLRARSRVTRPTPSVTSHPTPGGTS